MRARARAALRLLGRLLGWAALALAALLLSTLFHLRLPIARRVASEQLDVLVSSEIRGELRIGTLEQVSLRAIVARDVTLFDGEGRRVVQAKRLSLTPDAQALLALGVGFSHARLEDATVWLYDAGDGLPSLLTSFDSPRPGHGGGEPLHVAVDGIELARVTLLGDLLGLHGLRAEVARAAGRMDIGRDVHVRIDSAQGSVVEPFGFVGQVDALSGTISTVSTEGIDLHARAHRGDERASARIRLAKPRPDPDAKGVFRLELTGENLSVYTLQALSFDFLPEIAVRLSGKLELRGPFAELDVRSELTTDAGPAHVQGHISKPLGASVTVSSERLLLAKLFPGAPDVPLTGRMQIDTPPGGGEPRLQLALEPFTYQGFAVPAFYVDGAAIADGVRVDRASAEERGLRVNAEGHISSTGAVHLRVRGSVADIGSDANLARFVHDAHGRLDADVRVRSGALGERAIEFDGRIALVRLRYGLLKAQRITLQGSAHGDPERPELRLAVRGEEVSVGEYALGDPQLSLRGGPRKYRADGQFVSQGRRTFNASATIVAEKESFLVDADPIEFAVGEGSWRGAVQRLRITPGQSVELEMLRLASHSQRLEVHGIVREQGEDRIEAQLQDFDLAALHALLGGRLWLEQGHADAHLILSGDLDRPDIQLQGALRDGKLIDVTGVNALYFVTYRAGQLDADGEVDLGERGILHLTGGGRLDPRVRDPVAALRGGSYDLELQGQGLALSLWPAAARAGVSGALNGNLRFQGTLERPEFSGTLGLDPVKLPGWPELYVTAEGGYATSQLVVRLALRDERGPLLSADGQMQLDWAALSAEPELFVRVLSRGPWQVTGHTAQRRLDQLPAPIAAFAPYPAAVSSDFDVRKQDGATSGELDFEGSWSGALHDSACAKDVEVKLHGSIALAHDSSRVELEALHGKSRVITLNAAVDTPVDRWLDQGHVDRLERFRASSRIQIDSIRRMPYLCEYGNGSLRAELELDGGLSAEPILVAMVDGTLFPRIVRQAGRQSVRVRSCQGDPIRAHLELNADRDRMQIAGGTSGCHGGPTTLEALVPVHWDELLVLPTPRPDQELRGSIQFDRAQLKPLLDRLPGVRNSDAIARGVVQLEGLVSRLSASGQVAIENGRIYLVSTGQELTEIDGGLTFHGNWAKLEYLSAHQDTGLIEASGGIGFSGFMPERLRIALRSDKFPVKREGVDMGWVTGAAAIDAEIKPERARAAIKLHQLMLRLADDENRALQPLGAHPDVTVVTEQVEPVGESYPIELVIEGSRNLTVKRNDFEADLATEVALRYRDPDLNVGGYIQFLSGEFEVFGKRFDINSGALRFDGSTDLNPDVYLLATQRPDVAGASPVTVSVTGTLAEPVVSFNSDICPGDSGAMTYLLSGRCVADDSDLAQESGDAREAITSGILSGVATLGVQSETGGVAPRIAIETGGGSSRIGAGFSSQSIVPKFMRKLVQRVYIQGGVVTGSAEEQGAAADPGTRNPLDFLIELYFPHNIVGAGRFEQNSWGLDVIWEP